MITTNKNFRSGLLGRLMVLPVIVLLLGLFAFNLKSHPFRLPASRTIRVVIDAGHGGEFPGLVVKGIREEDLNLGIAKKIQSLAKDYQVEVIMTRENAEAAGHTGNLHDDLRYRVSLADKEGADLFVSIHGNSAESANGTDGFEIYVPGKTSAVYAGSVRLGSSITESITKDHPVATELKQRANGIMVLDKATVPAVLILFGNLEKKSDFDFITDENNQERIARDILEGIRKYSAESTIYQPHAQDPVDTLTRADMDKLDPNSIFSMSVAHDLITIKFKDGKKSVVKVTEEMRTSWKSTDTKGSILTKVEVEATYPGGIEAWQKYLSNTLKYPEDAARREIQGAVVVEFIVNEDGSLTQVHAISGPKGLRAESIRIIAESGKWVPAKQHGRTVSSYHKQPITYRLERQ